MLRRESGGNKSVTYEPASLLMPQYFAAPRRDEVSRFHYAVDMFGEGRRTARPAQRQRCRLRHQSPEPSGNSRRLHGALEERREGAKIPWPPEFTRQQLGFAQAS